MDARDFRKFFLSIVLPSILAIALFIISFYVIVIPSFERTLMNGKREMISQLTNSATSVVADYYNQAQEGLLSEEEAREMAAEKVRGMRYGEDEKDYFWITDMRPYMIMHPYRDDLNGTDLSDYQDPHGKKLFTEAVAIVNNQGDGFINYIWQWKDDTTRLVSKLSYVKGFDRWDWIIGTGIYLEDVRLEIRRLEGRLLRISLIIILVIAGSLSYIVAGSLKIEKRRGRAEERLKLSREKYRMLVESSTIGTLMMVDNRIIYANQKFLGISGLTRDQIGMLAIEDLFDLRWDVMVGSFGDPGTSLALESRINRPERRSEVLLTISRVEYNSRYSYILVVNELAGSVISERESRRLSEDLQASLLLMNQPVHQLVTGYHHCDIDSTIKEAAVLFRRKGCHELIVRQKGKVVGIVTASDFLLRAIAGGTETDSPVSVIMSAPVIGVREDALIYEALLVCKKNNVSHLLVNNSMGECIGTLSYSGMLEVQQNYITLLMDGAERAESTDELRHLYQRMNAIVEMLVFTGTNPGQITRLISSFADRVNCRTVELAVERLGKPPCRFCFIVMGSLGRHEQTLATDQDNGIIYDDNCSDMDEAALYFRKLGERISDDLNHIGYNFCKGNIMAANPEWVKPLNEWKVQFSRWINDSDPQSLLEVSIFFDFRGLCGDASLAGELRDHLNSSMDAKAVFFYHLSQEVIRFKPPVGLFGQIVGEHLSDDSNIVDIKKLLMPLIGFARLYALKIQVPEINTIRRFQLITDRGEVQRELSEELTEAYNILMGARLKTQVAGSSRGSSPSNSLDINRLTAIERSTVKKVLSLINELITKIRIDFKGTLS